MSTQDRFIPGVPCWVDTTQPDPDAAAKFYGELFGWEFEDVAPAGAPGVYMSARLPDGDVAAIGSLREGAPSVATWNTYVLVDSADDTAAAVRDAGGSIVMEPANVGEAGRMAVVADPAGAAFSVWEPRSHGGASVVNEHGAVVFNDLYTRDIEGVKAFYGAVFGWDTLDLGGGLMWTLTGYGDHLEQRTPGMRENMAAMGAPEGFEDVVATIVPIPDDQPDTPAHWGLTFAVDDVDAIVAKAAELGARVILPAFDAPWVRIALLADPQGATFAASQFAPENKDLEVGAGAAGAG